jgi:5-methylcytosine-specific restriction endonuclease McrA
MKNWSGSSQKHRRRNSPEAPFPIRLIGRLIVWAWRKRFPTVPNLKPGERPSDDIRRRFYQSPEWKRLSWKIKVKRGWRCECCGAKSPQVKIVTDHIRSLRNHWALRLDPKNMQVLCEDCNLAKGSWDYTDFRQVRTGLVGWLVWFWSGLRWFWLDRNRKCKDV